MIRLQLSKFQSSDFEPCHTITHTLPWYWLSNVKNIIDHAGGLGSYWYAIAYGDREMLVVLKTRLADMTRQSWSESVHSNSLCINSRMFKDTLHLEPYLSLLWAKDWVIITRFCCGNHNLPIAESRWQQHNTTMKACSLCLSNKPGDEFHYILECPAFQSKHSALLQSYYWCHPDANKFMALFSSDKKMCFHQCGQIQKIGWESRPNREK